MRLLTAVFSYNRYFLLKNTLDSWMEYGPGGDLLIVDDGSTDTRVEALLAEVAQKPGCTVRSQSRDNGQAHGGLYANMNVAAAHAIERGYDYVFFLQDDLQFMWKDDGFQERVERIFRDCPDAAMVSPVFQRGILAPQMRQRLVPHPSGPCWHLTPYAIVDVGIMPVRLLKEKEWLFGKEERSNSDHWVKWGYKLYAMRAPTVAFVPWPEVWSGTGRFGKERSPKEAYFLKPLDDTQTSALRSSTDIPFAEDYCLPWKWSCLSPYWLTKFSWKYYKKYAWERIKNGDGWPKIVRAD